MSLPYDQLKEKVLTRYGHIDSIPDSVYNALISYRDNGTVALDDDKTFDILVSERDYTPQEEKSRLANEMRNRAKTDFVEDQEAQQKAEYDSRFESPEGKLVKNLFPYSNSYDQTKYERVLNAAKDITSLPGRLGAETIGALSEVAGSLQKGDLTGNDERIAAIGSNFMDNVGNITDGNLGKKIATDPLLPVLGATNLVTLPGRAIYSGLARTGLGTGAIVASEYAQPGDMNVRENAFPIVTGAALNALPLLKYIPFKGRNIAQTLETRPFVEGAEKVLKEDVKHGGKYVLSSKRDNPTKIPVDDLKKLWQTNTTLDSKFASIGEWTGKSAAGTAAAGTGAAMFGAPGAALGFAGQAIGGKIGKSALGTPERTTQALKELDALLSDNGRMFATLTSSRTKKPTIKEDTKYSSDIRKALFDDKLTETEFNAYKMPENKEKFYERFSEYR